MSIALTIRDQITPKSFFMMGAKHLTDTGKGLRWKLGRNAKTVSYVHVELDPDDTYTVTFTRVRSMKVKVLSEHAGIYVDMLRELIERETGLCLTFPTVRFSR